MIWGRSKAGVESGIGQSTPDKVLQCGFTVEIGALNPDGVGKPSHGSDFVRHISKGRPVGGPAYYCAHIVLLTGEQASR